MRIGKRTVAVIDSETDPFRHGLQSIDPFLWGYYDGETYQEFNDTGALVDFLENLNAIVYCHNGGKFDFHFLLEYIEKRKKILVINGRLAKCKIGKCELRDSYNILPVPLSAFQKDKFDYSLMTKENRYKPENFAKIRAYLKNDCIYLYNAVAGFIAEYGNNITLASAAFKQWKKISGLESPKSNRKFYDAISPYYFGGRVTPFKAGIFEGNYKIIDITSAYPFAMREASHPYSPKFDCPIPRHVPDRLLPYCFLSVSCKSNGAFPLATDEKLLFPIGKATYNITGWEFIAAKETNSISDIKINSIMYFKERVTFDDYVDHFFKKKSDAEKEGNEHARTYAKLFLNSLYGKFGMARHRYKEFYLDDYGVQPMLVENGHEFQASTVFGDFQLFERALDIDENANEYINLATAASITGYVRAYLWRALCSVDAPLYCDTDSIICRGTGSLNIGDGLGQWAMEGEADLVAIAGRKLYACRMISGKKAGKWKTASKGVKLSGPDIVKVAKGDVIKYDSEAPTFSLRKSGINYCSRNVQKTFDEKELIV